MKNLFLNHITKKKGAKPALEMEANDPIKPTNVEAVADPKKIDSEFEGIKTDKKPEDQNLDASKTTAIGTEPAFDKEQEDYVAQGQEEGLALESLAESIRADLKLARRHRMRSHALEDIAEVVQTTLDGGDPVQSVNNSEAIEPGIAPEAALAITRALDMDELGEETQQSVALEAFGFSRVVATESLIDRTINKSNESKGESRSLLKRAAGKLSNFGTRVGKALKGAIASADTVANDMRDVGDAVLARTTLSDKAQSKIAGRLHNVTGARTPTDCVRGAHKQLNDLQALAATWPKAVGRINDAISSGESTRIIAASNDALKFLKRVGDTAGSKLPGMAMKLKTESVSEGTSPKAIDYEYPNSDVNFSGAIAPAKFTDLEEVRGAMSRAEAALNQGFDHIFGKANTGWDAPAVAKNSGEGDGGTKGAIRVAREIVTSGSDMIGGAIFNTAWALSQNANAVASWGVETITAARNTRNQ